MADLILIPGSGHGGWYFDAILPKLRAAGHSTFPITLTGLDHEISVNTQTNLSTHISDVLELIEAAQLKDVFMVAHSYGGMVMTGAATKTNSNVSGLLYLDAMVPNPGQSQWDLLFDDMRQGFLSAAHDGLHAHPSPDFKSYRPRVMPHPLATMIEPLHFDAATLAEIPKTYVLAEKFFGPEGPASPFRQIYESVRQKPDWTALTLGFGHDLVEECPELVVDIALAAIARG